MLWWENEFVRFRKGTLHLAGFSAGALVRRLGTPLFVYGIGRIRENYRRLASAFAAATDLEVRIAYAMKANPHPDVLNTVREAGGWIDAVSPGEIARALASGIPADRILFTGTSVSGSDLEAAFAVDGLTVNIDALEQLEVMRRVRGRSRPGRRIRVAVRWNPGLGRGFNPKVVTAGDRSDDGTPIKFGVEEPKVLETFRRARAYGFEPVGLHQHLGSGWVLEDAPAVLTAVDRMVEKAAELERAGFGLEFLDFGGGFGPRYARDQRLFPLRAYARAIGRKVRAAGLSVRALAVEPGKYLLADAGVLLLRVQYVKKSYGNVFACVDAGTFNSLPRPAVYGQARHEIVGVRRAAGIRRRKVTVAGHLCETGDVFGKDVLLAGPREGDLLAVLNAGAYGRSMASNYNLRPIPAEVVL
jgi:diaminopimelate decarboxylase